MLELPVVIARLNSTKIIILNSYAPELAERLNDQGEESTTTKYDFRKQPV